METKVKEIEKLEDKINILRKELREKANLEVGSFFTASVLKKITWVVDVTYRDKIDFVGIIPYEISKKLRKMRCRFEEIGSHFRPSFEVEGIVGSFEVNIREGDIDGSFLWEEFVQMITSDEFIFSEKLKKYLRDSVFNFDDSLEDVKERKKNLLARKAKFLAVLELLE